MVVFTSTGFAQTDAERQEKVAMRKIGHEVLLSIGDSTSRVLPIEKEGNGYRISFSSEFGFDPDQLAATIDTIMASNNIATSYVVEVNDCDTNFVVYSYKGGSSANQGELACRGRIQPVGCYNLFVTILEFPEPLVSETDNELVSKESNMVNRLIWILASIALILGFIVFVIKRGKRVAGIDPNVIPIGAYLFNRRKMELSFKDESIELTSKECDLLQLLCDSTNDTVERETILKMVWGDEGDYVGRTLDVFISKLRKKLEADSNVKIVNVRGVGYKLVLNS